MENGLTEKQIKQIALGETIKILLEARETLRDRLTNTDLLGNRIAVHFDDSDEQQDAYNRALDGIVSEFEGLLKKQMDQLIAMGHF